MKCSIYVVRRSKYLLIYICDKPIAKIAHPESVEKIVIETPKTVEIPCTTYEGPYEDCFGIGCPD